MAKSLLEGMDTGIGSSRGKSAAKKNEGGKLVFAVALLVIAGVVVAWSQGWIFSSAPKAPVISPEEQAQQQKIIQEQQKNIEAKTKTGQVKLGGTS